MFRHPREKRNFSDRESVDSSSFSIPTTTGEFVGGKETNDNVGLFHFVLRLHRLVDSLPP